MDSVKGRSISLLAWICLDPALYVYVCTVHMKHYFATLIKSVALKLVVPFLYFVYACMYAYICIICTTV